MMEDTTNQDESIETNNNDNNNDEEEYDSDEDPLLEEHTVEQLKQNDPSVTNLDIMNLHANDCIFYTMNWKEDGNCISNNTHLKKVYIYNNDEHLGKNGHKKQQLQDFFSCINKNRSIEYLSFSSDRDDELCGGLIEELCGHSSLTRLQIHDGLGSIACSAVGQVLKHPQSKLKHLELPYSKLDDDRLGVLCSALVGNNTMETLQLNGSDKISSLGWRALSTVLRDPNCKLTKLNLDNSSIIQGWTGLTFAIQRNPNLKLTQLSFCGINLNNKGADDLGSALIGSPVKVLDLSSNQSITGTGWQTLFNKLSQTSIECLILHNTKMEDAGLAALACIGTLKRLRLRSVEANPAGWWTLFNLLQRIGTQLVSLTITHNNISNVGLAFLGSLLRNMPSIRTLDMSDMGNPRFSYTFSRKVTSQGWISFFNALQDSNLNLEQLDFSNNCIDDEGIQLLARLVSSMASLKHLRLSQNDLVTPTGWQALTGYLQSPNLSLKELYLAKNNLNDDAVVSFARALEQNKTLKLLSLYDSHDDGNALTAERGWNAVSVLLCNKTSIMDTYNSNHTLKEVSIYDDTPDDTESYMDLNKIKDKAEVARQKILQTHFSTEDLDSSKLQVLLDMELEMMPAAIEWIGRPTNDDWFGRSVSGLSLLYNVTRRMPDLFDSTAQKKQCAKRKRNSCVN